MELAQLPSVIWPLGSQIIIFHPFASSIVMFGSRQVPHMNWVNLMLTHSHRLPMLIHILFLLNLCHIQVKVSNGHWTIATLDQATFETASYKLVNILKKVDIWKKENSKYVHLPYFILYQIDEDMFTYSINCLFSHV